jgi:hypothetical protein
MAARAHGSGRKPKPMPASWYWYLVFMSGTVSVSWPSNSPTVRGAIGAPNRPR